MRGELRSKACSKGRVVTVVTCCVRLIPRPAALIGVAISALLLAGSVTAQDQPSPAWLQLHASMGRRLHAVPNARRQCELSD